MHACLRQATSSGENDEGEDGEATGAQAGARRGAARDMDMQARIQLPLLPRLHAAALHRYLVALHVASRMLEHVVKPYPSIC